MSLTRDNESPINQAHAYANKANAISQGNPTVDGLKASTQLYEKAADLFDQLRKNTADAGASGTFTLLAAENRKKARDMQRRVTLATAVTASSGSRVAGSPQRAQDDVFAAEQNRQRRRKPGSSHTSMDQSIAVRLSSGVPPPPFAIPPGNTDSQPSTSNVTSPPPPGLPSRRGDCLQPSSPSGLPSSSGVPPASATASTLYASSSSSERGGSDSFVRFSHPLEASDPFARFWAVLETAFDQMSNPVAFAAVPLDIPRAATGESEKAMEAKGKKKEKRRERDKDRDRGGDKEKDSGKARPEVADIGSASSGDSFYMVAKKQATKFQVAHSERSTIASASKAKPKTHEELSLENASLRASLDAMAVHTQNVETELKRVKESEAKRGELMKSVVLGVKLEAQKAIQGHELLRSQMVASMAQHNSPFNSLPRSRPALSSHMTLTTRLENESAGANAKLDQKGKEGETPILRKRIAELEEKVRLLQTENERARSHLQKYRDRFEKLKANARLKKERQASLATLGEEEGEI